MHKAKAALVACMSLALVASIALAGEAPSADGSGQWLSPAKAPADSMASARADAIAAYDAPFTLAEATSKPADAKEEAPPAAATATKLWEVKIKVYSWITGINGHVGVGKRVGRLDVDYGDVLDNLDLVEAMAPVNVEARYGAFGFYADLYYVSLENSVGKGPARVNLTFKQTILELGGYYRVGTWALNPEKSSTLTVDAIGGARYNRLEGNIGLELPTHAISVGGVREWWDPFVGPRVTWQANDKLSMFVRTDVGGFGIENCSKFVWQFIAGVDYDITKNFFVELGYRLLDTDFHSSSGPRSFTYDVTMQGPYLAIGFKF